jgi:hypothetical protein
MKRPLLLILILVVLLIVVCFFYIVYTGKIQGIVKDSIENKPILNASIKIDGKLYSTDKNGQFTIYKPVFRSVKIEIEKSGFKTYAKEIPFKGLTKSINLEVLLEPLIYKNIIEYASKDIASYESYIFRYKWKIRINEPDEKTTYMIYQLSKDGILRFKFVEDNKIGNTISEREIIRTQDTIYYKDKFNQTWIKAKEESIPLKLQEPLDILQLFKDSEDPVSFVYDNMVSLYKDQANNLLLKDELSDLASKDIDKSTKLIQTRLFIAKWNVIDGRKEIKFYLDSKDYSLLRAELDEESSDESGKLLKQNLVFYITNINQDIKIEIPKI